GHRALRATRACHVHITHRPQHPCASQAQALHASEITTFFMHVSAPREIIQMAAGTRDYKWRRIRALAPPCLRLATGDGALNPRMAWDVLRVPITESRQRVALRTL